MLIHDREGLGSLFGVRVREEARICEVWGRGEVGRWGGEVGGEKVGRGGEVQRGGGEMGGREGGGTTTDVKTRLRKRINTTSTDAHMIGRGSLFGVRVQPELKKCSCT